MKKIIAIVLLAILTSCAADLPSKKTEKVFEEIRLDVGKIVFVDIYESTYQHPFAEHLLPQKLSYMIKKRTKSLLETTPNSSRILKILIEDASVIESQERSEDRVINADITNYKASIKLKLEIYDQAMPLSPEQIGTINLYRLKSIDKDSSIAAHELLFKKLYELVDADYSKILTESIMENFSKYVR